MEGGWSNGEKAVERLCVGSASHVVETDSPHFRPLVPGRQSDRGPPLDRPLRAASIAGVARHLQQRNRSERAGDLAVSQRINRGNKTRKQTEASSQLGDAAASSNHRQWVRNKLSAARVIPVVEGRWNVASKRFDPTTQTPLLPCPGPGFRLKMESAKAAYLIGPQVARIFGALRLHRRGIAITTRRVSAMAPRCPGSSSTLAPFLYPSVFRLSAPRAPLSVRNGAASHARHSSTVNDLPESRLNPRPDDYSTPGFADKAELTLYAGRGGNGCISFLREAYMPDGPPNGGDGGVGGNIYIQAAHGETSLFKLARRRFIRAGRGKHGQGSAKSGSRGEDVVITVPVGTIVREIERQDPAAEEAANIKAWRAMQKEQRKQERIAEEERRRQQKLAAQELAERQAQQDDGSEIAEQADDGLEEELVEDYSRRAKRIEEYVEEDEEDADDGDPQRHKWLLYPGMSKTDMKSAAFPPLPTRHPYFKQPPAPIYHDLSRPTPTPILLAAGGVGGLGNPHFNSREHPRPLFATKGDEAVTMKIELELKLLADVGLVGLPNAGKSTLLRAITNSRTRVGNWAFTTLQPNVGTVVLDKNSGRPEFRTHRRYPGGPGQPDVVEAEPRTRFSVADIPGLIEGAHLDRGLGIAFLRHVERARVLAFVIDLAAGNAVRALDSLWREVGLYAQMRDEEEQGREIDARVDWDMDPEEDRPVDLAAAAWETEDKPAPVLQIAGKPWFVVATKADLPETQENFRELQAYVESITRGETPHPSGVDEAWTKKCATIPVSAINGQGVDRIVHWTVGLLDE